MYNALRHWDRNMDRFCDDPDEENGTIHFGRYDGYLYAYAGGDIGRLLGIINDLKTENNQLIEKINILQKST